MQGPRYLVHPDEDYHVRLEREDRRTWYGDLCKPARPRGFARLDDVGGPSPGDLVVTMQSIHDDALHARRDMRLGRQPDPIHLDALEVVLHEHCHCMVRYGPDGKPRPDDLRRYSHPNKPWPAIVHAFGPDCRLGLNAFTGLLRHRPTPRDAWYAGLLWFDSVAPRTEPLPWIPPPSPAPNP